MKKLGQRGEVRGKVGMKVENCRLLGLVNEEIDTDYRIIADRVQEIKGLYAEMKSMASHLLQGSSRRSEDKSVG